MPYKYSDTAADVDFADSGDLFKNVDPEPLSFCQIDTCQFMKSDCKTPATYPGLAMTTTSPFGISRDSKQVHGFDYDVCVKCNNG